MEQTNEKETIKRYVWFVHNSFDTNRTQQQQQQQQQQVTPFNLRDEEVFKIDDDPLLETSVRQVLNTPQGRQRLQSQLGPLG